MIIIYKALLGAMIYLSISKLFTYWNYSLNFNKRTRHYFLTQTIFLVMNVFLIAFVNTFSFKVFACLVVYHIIMVIYWAMVLSEEDLDL